MKGVIYKYTFPDGKVYIGQTRRNPELRHKEHLDPVTGPLNKSFWDEYQKQKSVEYEILRTIENDNLDKLIEELNALETYFIITLKAYDPAFGCNRRIQGTESSDSKRILHEKYVELYQSLLPERMARFKIIEDKVWHTKEPLTEEEKSVMKDFFSQPDTLFGLPEKFDYDNLNAIDTDADYNEDIFFLEKAFSWWNFKITDDLECELQDFIDENRDAILEEERDKKTICALDKDGNVVMTFYSFNEIAQYFNVVRADNVRNVIKGKQKSAYGYFWKLKSDL